MPEWYDPLTNSSLAVGLVGFACWGVVRFSRWIGPILHDLANKKGRVHEAQAELADSLKITQQQQSSLLERSVGMLHDHGIKLGSHGEMLTLHGHRLDHVAKTVDQIKEEVWRKRLENDREDERRLPPPSGIGVL